MTEVDDIELLRQYARENSEAAFATLAGRHVNLVYSVALRRVGNPHAAEEITQAVFIILARKAKSFSRKTILTGWLHQTTRLTAANFLRTEIRRAHREQEAFMQSAFSKSETWTQIAPLLDDAIAKLGERDRDAILLRYFENKSAREMAAALRVDEPAAQKRVTRAVEKLRAFFAKRGVTLTAAAIAGAVSANSVQAAPVGLAATVTAAAAKGAAVSASTLALVKGAINLMAWAKAKTATLIGTAFLVACGATIYLWEVNPDGLSQQAFGDRLSRTLTDTSPQVRIVPTKYSDSDGGGFGIDDQRIGISMPMESLIMNAYGLHDDLRLVISTKLPDGKYDYIANLPTGSGEALQQEIKKQFGIVGRFEPQPKDVLVLKVKDASALKLTSRLNKFPYAKAGEWSEGKQFHWGGQPTSGLADWLEGYFQIPVVDQIGMTNASGYDFTLNWDVMSRDSEKLKRTLNQVGLELIPTNMPIEMLVIEKVKN
jgi:uncharacterized protein (TIGR03435 family)